MKSAAIPNRFVVGLLVVLTLTSCGGGGAAVSEPAGTATDPPATPTPAPPQPGSPTAPPAPSSVTIQTPDRAFSPSSATIAANGIVTWQATDDRHEIVFTGQAPPGGNVGELEEDASASRTFPTPGTYGYECLRHNDRGMRGTITVVASGTPPPPPGPGAPPSGSAATVTTPGTTFNPSAVSITAGGSVTWQFSGARHNVTFQGAAPTGGNIPDQDAGTSASRTFPTAGTYDYVCTRHQGMAGRVTVQ